MTELNRHILTIDLYWLASTSSRFDWRRCARRSIQSWVDLVALRHRRRRHVDGIRHESLGITVGGREVPCRKPCRVAGALSRGRGLHRLVEFENTLMCSSIRKRSARSSRKPHCGGFIGMLLGSVNTAVAHASRVPVIVARQHWPKPFTPGYGGTERDTEAMSDEKVQHGPGAGEYSLDRNDNRFGPGVARSSTAALTTCSMRGIRLPKALRTRRRWSARAARISCWQRKSRTRRRESALLDEEDWDRSVENERGMGVPQQRGLDGRERGRLVRDMGFGEDTDAELVAGDVGISSELRPRLRALRSCIIDDSRATLRATDIRSEGRISPLCKCGYSSRIMMTTSVSRWRR